MTLSGNGWSSNPDHDFPESSPTAEDYEFNQSGKPAKAIIGIGLLVVFGVALTFFHPVNHDASTLSPMVSDSAHTNNVTGAPGQTSGQAPTAPSTSAN